MADSKIFLALALACLPAFVCLSPLAEVVAHDDLGFGNTTTTTTTTAAIDTSSALPLRCTDAAAPSISSTRHDLDADGGSTLCLRKVSTHPYDGVLPLKDGSGRLLCWNRNGLIWLAAPPVDVDPATGSVLSVTGKPLIDLGSRISQDAAARGRGLAGVAVHSSGRLLMSYYTTDDDVGPAPDGVGAFLVVDQLSASSWSEHEANRADPAQSASRVFSMALPQAEPLPSSGVLDYYYGGQILFRPNNADPFLYLVTGPAQSDGQLQAKILRFHVGQDSPSGNGTVTPVDVQSYAAWLGIPRRCAFDAERPQDLYCAIAKDEQEQVYLISDPDAPSSSSTPPSPSLLVAHQRPTPGTPPSLVGGLLYRGYADNTLTGSYIYMDRSEFWWTVASPARNYTITRNLRVTCSASTTSPCRSGDFAGGGGGVTSFGEDEGNNALLLATDGVYQVVGPSLCRHAATHTKAPMSTKKLLEWVLGALLATTTLGGGYIVYKKCSCFNSMNDINVNAPNGNVNVFNGNNGIQLAVNN